MLARMPVLHHRFTSAPAVGLSRRRRVQGSPRAGSLRAWIQPLVAGALVLVLVMAGRSSVSTTLLLGGAVLLWSMAAFVTERPNRRDRD